MEASLLLLALVPPFALGGRAQLVVGQISDALAGEDRARRPVPLLATGLVCAALTAGVMAFAGSYVAARLPAVPHLILVAGALGLAALELAWPVRVAPAREPTRSLGAIGAVLMVRQMTDAARLTIFAVAILSRDPIGVALEGGIGGAIAAALGWSLGADSLSRWTLRPLRLTLSGPLILTAFLIGLNVY